MTVILALLTSGFSSFKTLLAKYWKAFSIVGVILLLFFVHRHYVHQYGEAQFKLGVDTTISKMKTEVAKRDTVNRAIEDRAQSGIQDFATTKSKQDDTRHAVEKKSEDRIAISVSSVPMWNSQECAITPQVLQDRNAIRNAFDTK